MFPLCQGYFTKPTSEGEVGDKNAHLASSIMEFSNNQNEQSMDPSFQETGGNHVLLQLLELTQYQYESIPRALQSNARPEAQRFTFHNDGVHC